MVLWYTVLEWRSSQERSTQKTYEFCLYELLLSKYPFHLVPKLQLGLDGCTKSKTWFVISQILPSCAFPLFIPLALNQETSYYALEIGISCFNFSVDSVLSLSYTRAITKKKYLYCQTLFAIC